ncbi:MAG: M73 family metallopeptidase [Euryarchaeota archaeon]|nr:M73 family metallopeptidase [Euryarchaeota archaeon]
MKQIMQGLLVIGFVLMATGAGTLAYFSDTETSSGNTLTAGTLDLKTGILTLGSTAYTANLTPNAGNDTTGQSLQALTSVDLAKLATSNDIRYNTNKWEQYVYNDTEYLEFQFPDIPSGATVNSAVLKFEWQRQASISGARLKIYDGSTWQIHTLSLPSGITDQNDTIDLKSLYGIDTASKVNALKIWFQAIDGTGNLLTKHNWVQVDIGYTVPTPTTVWSDGVSSTWTMSNMIPGVSTVSKTVSLKNNGSINEDHVEISFSHTLAEGTPLEFGYPVSVPGDMARYIEITSMTYGGTDLKAVLTNANGNGWKDLEDVTLPANAAVLDDLSPAGGGTDFTMSLLFRGEAPNDLQGDSLTTTVSFTSNQHTSQ